MRHLVARRWAWLGVAVGVATGSPLPAQQSPPPGPEQAYIDYLKAVHGGNLDGLEAHLGAEGAAQWKALPGAGRRMAAAGLVMPGLYEPPRAVKVETAAEGVVLRLAASVDTERTMTGSPGTPSAVTGRVEMKRRGSGWAIVSEQWRSGDGKPYWSGLVAPGLIPKTLAGEPVDWATGEIRTVISAQAAYSSANNGYYGPLTCLAQPGSCLPDYEVDGPAFILGDLASPDARYGFRRRFDEGARAPAKDVGPGKASRSSVASYAYWIIPEPVTPASRARCGDSSGTICEMPDATAPSTAGECPPGCTAVR